MKIVCIEDGRPGDALHAAIVFADDFGEFKKHVLVSSCARKVLPTDKLRAEMAYQFAKAVREAELDQMHRMFGDAWRDHYVGHDNKFLERMAKQAAALRPDLFGAES